MKGERNRNEQRESIALTLGFISLSFDEKNNHAALNSLKDLSCCWTVAGNNRILLVECKTWHDLLSVLPYLYHLKKD